MFQHRLHPKQVAQILKEAAQMLKRLPNINVATTSISSQITICGDLHGKLDDLLVIFHKVSQKEPHSNRYLRLSVKRRLHLCGNPRIFTSELFLPKDFFHEYFMFDTLLYLECHLLWLAFTYSNNLRADFSMAR